jgi:NAD(P)-dependent dehydrogenase (short-subunit alcohol dehydrogenase family)
MFAFVFLFIIYFFIKNEIMQKGWPRSCYGISKVAETALTKVLARDESYIKKRILINACCPGWVFSFPFFVTLFRN